MQEINFIPDLIARNHSKWRKFGVQGTSTNSDFTISALEESATQKNAMAQFYSMLNRRRK